MYENADFNCFYFILMTLKAVFALALKKKQNNCLLMEAVGKDSWISENREEGAKFQQRGVNI